MKKNTILSIACLTFLLLATPAFAASSDVTKIQTFIQSIVQLLVTLAGAVSVAFFVWGGFGYITSSGSPEKLQKSKDTLWYAALGLTIVLGAFVITSIITQLATAAFGAAQ